MGCIIPIIALFKSVAVLAPLYFNSCPDHTDPILLCTVEIENNQPTHAECMDLRYHVIFKGTVQAVGPQS